MMPLLTRTLRRLRRRRDVTFDAWLKALPPEDLERWFLRMHEALGIRKEEVPDINEMTDLEFEDYIARLRSLNGLRRGL
ncbi:MAG TPA: hypothetical protein VE135_15910 [Pyrinomonadaceae bacterium]|nr:hypothetical protein [Pyrinomonadaceae bacterium]